MAERKPLSKTTRFEVFKRDCFTCQYCGAQPPDSVLEVDHITAVANGGDNQITNLLTACDRCNRGKGARRLEVVPRRPDADLLYMETQQEIAELKRFQKARVSLEKMRAGAVSSLQDAWCSVSGLDWCPTDKDLTQMLVKFSVEGVLQAVENTAAKVACKRVSKYDFVRYMWGILHRMREEANGA